MEKPKPHVGPDNILFWEGCKRHQLVFQKCTSCGHVRWPPSHICPLCHAFATEEVVSAGRGKIYSYVVYHFAYHPALVEELPYVVALVELEEGPRILSNIVGENLSDLDCELPVELIWDEQGEIPLPKFRVRRP
ncbi:MAG TPA: Zn-ribbon domain-containing OB-fold protein [Syntrophales bacterium]|nr:Zn-ribbon domain-containing OB-fold protein [Syntrophales bacterium]HPO35917.1 Zn-ribbon domain-containing OB-fold protein [Syntrophales bacterium]